MFKRTAFVMQILIASVLLGCGGVGVKSKQRQHKDALTSIRDYHTRQWEQAWKWEQAWNRWSRDRVLYRKCLLGTNAFGPPPPKDHQFRAKSEIESSLADPFSAVFRFRPDGIWYKQFFVPTQRGVDYDEETWLVPAWSTFVEVNAKNKFGGYVGFTLYSVWWYTDGRMRFYNCKDRPFRCEMEPQQRVQLDAVPFESLMNEGGTNRCGSQPRGDPPSFGEFPQVE